MAPAQRARRRVVAVAYPGFELLDLAGPLEMFGVATRELEESGTRKFEGGYDVEVASMGRESCRASNGPVWAAEVDLVKLGASGGDGRVVDILLIPGGMGARSLVKDEAFLTALRGACASARTVASVCTGSVLLAAAGVLDGRPATSNKRAWQWVVSYKTPQWKPKARWVRDGNVWTSSGIAGSFPFSPANILVFDQH